MLLLLLLACQPDPTATGTWDLIEASAWAPVASDPFLDGEDPPECQARGVVLEEGVLEVLTELCPWATLSQPSLVDVQPGDTLELFAFHGPLTAPEAAEGVMAVQADGEPLWSVTVPIPSEDGVYIERWQAERGWEAGAELILHVHNHGANAWRFVRLERTRGEDAD
ncbi:MAG: hypothetical protein H6740_13425 [Alphaproteobacteria bacterium]|nr:hypothetical protein [Alphaproteobacteria bacterium]